MSSKQNFRKNDFEFVITDTLKFMTNDILKVDFPGLMLSTAYVPVADGLRIKHPGDEYSFDQLGITIRVRDDLANIKAVQDILFRLKNPDNGNFDITPLQGTLLKYGSSTKVLAKIEFKNIFPVGFSGISFESNTTDVDWEEVDIMFEYDSFKIV